MWLSSPVHLFIFIPFIIKIHEGSPSDRRSWNACFVCTRSLLCACKYWQYQMVRGVARYAKTCTGAELTRVVVEWGYPFIGGLCPSKVVFMNVYWPVRWSAIRNLFHAACRIAKSGAINHADLGSIFLCLNLLAMAAHDNMLHSSIHLGTSKLLQLFGEFGGNCSPETLERASYWQVPKRKWYHGWRVPGAIHNKGTLNLTWALQHSLFWVRQDWWLFHFRESLRKMKADTCNSRGLMWIMCMKKLPNLSCPIQASADP